MLGLVYDYDKEAEWWLNTFCGSCGAEPKKCRTRHVQKCGSRDRNNLAGDGGAGNEALQLKAKDPSGFVEINLKLRSKRAGKTGQRAEERHRVDRTSNKETRILHEVREQNEEGKWEKVHCHEDSFPAKRRKK